MVDHVGIGTLKAAGLEGAVEVHQQVIAGGSLRHAGVEVDHQLVVAVHEVDLEALDTHLREMLADALNVAVHRIVSCPEDDAHALGIGIVHNLGKVYVRNDLEEVGLQVHRPAFVEDDIFDAVGGREVDIKLICLGVDAGTEVHAVDVPVVPPVPGDLAGLHPAPVGVGCGTAQFIDEVAVEQLAVFLSNGHYAPGQGCSCGLLGYIILGGAHDALQLVVAVLLDELGIGSKQAAERSSSEMLQIHSGIVQQV